MADGSHRAIADIEVGDEVVASDPETGEQGAREVTHVWVHDDTLMDLELDGETLTTTGDHPFWSVTDDRYERADELSAGERVLSADGSTVLVNALQPTTARWAAAYNLTVDGIHTYHVGAGSVLVHNTGDFCEISPAMEGPVGFRAPPGASAEEIAQVRRYVDVCNEALCANQLSETGRVSTSGALRKQAKREAAKERLRAEKAGEPYSGHAGHGHDTTWTGQAVPPAWLDLLPRVNESLGAQSRRYPVGYRPTVFEFLDD